MAFARARGNAGSPPIMVYSPASPCEERAVPPLAACRRSLPAVLCPLHHLRAGLATGRFFCPTRLGGAKAALQSCAPTPRRGANRLGMQGARANAVARRAGPICREPPDLGARARRTQELAGV